jgi:hypothetical protein
MLKNIAAGVGECVLSVILATCYVQFIADNL